MHWRLVCSTPLNQNRHSEPVFLLPLQRHCAHAIQTGPLDRLHAPSRPPCSPPPQLVPPALCVHRIFRRIVGPHQRPASHESVHVGICWICCICMLGRAGWLMRCKFSRSPTCRSRPSVGRRCRHGPSCPASCRVCSPAIGATRPSSTLRHHERGGSAHASRGKKWRQASRSMQQRG